MEHRLAGAPLVVAPGVLVQVGLEPLARDLLVGTAHPGLEIAEEALDRVRVDVAIDVMPRGVVDHAVARVLARKRLVGHPVVGEDQRGWIDVGPHGSTKDP